MLRLTLYVPKSRNVGKILAYDDQNSSQSYVCNDDTIEFTGREVLRKK